RLNCVRGSRRSLRSEFDRIVCVCTGLGYTDSHISTARCEESWSLSISGRSERRFLVHDQLAFCQRSLSTMPAAMAITKTMTRGETLARFANAGPGYNPTKPHPVPNNA